MNAEISGSLKKNALGEVVPMWAVRKLWIVMLVERGPTTKEPKSTREVSLDSAGSSRGCSPEYPSGAI